MLRFFPYLHSTFQLNHVSEILTNPKLIPPCGGKLVDLIVLPEEREELFAHAKTLPSVKLSERALCDLELLAIGGFSPLDKYMGAEDYKRVVSEMRLGNGDLFPIPITLPVDNDVQLTLDGEVALLDSRNEIVAVMTIDEIYSWIQTRCAKCFWHD